MQLGVVLFKSHFYEYYDDFIFIDYIALLLLCAYHILEDLIIPIELTIIWPRTLLIQINVVINKRVIGLRDPRIS